MSQVAASSTSSAAAGETEDSSESRLSSSSSAEDEDGGRASLEADSEARDGQRCADDDEGDRQMEGGGGGAKKKSGGGNGSTKKIKSSPTKGCEKAKNTPTVIISNSTKCNKVSSSDASACCEEVLKLRGALASLQEKLHQKEDEISRLSKIRSEVESEVEDLTASLFEEAHKMVRDANIRQASAEKAVVEANMKIDGLESEVGALKTLVLTSTPSQPNRHLHPQLNKDTKSGGKKAGGKAKAAAAAIEQAVSGGRHSRTGSSDSVASNSSFALLNSSAGGGGDSLSSNGHYAPLATGGVGNGSPEPRLSTSSPATSAAAQQSPASQRNSLGVVSANHHHDDDVDVTPPQPFAKSIDPTLRKDFLSWRARPTLDRASSPFLARLHAEDVDLALTFPNSTLAARVESAIAHNALCITPVKDFQGIPRECALLQEPVLCRYILKLLGDSESSSSKEDEVFYVSQLSRNRLSSVCDLMTYLRYVQQGLVKQHVNDVYWEIARLRRNVQLARLGYTLEGEHQ